MENQLITLGHRYGNRSDIPKESLAEAIKRLVSELTEEEFEEPDDEHAQVFVRRPDGSGLTAYVDGVMKLRLENSQVNYYFLANTVNQMQSVFLDFVRNNLIVEKSEYWVTDINQLTGVPGNEFRRYPAC